MMDDIEALPYDRASAKRIMLEFNDYAGDSRYFDKFSQALSLLYKDEYKIVYDSTIRRMNFHCIKCSKSMNNTQSLHAHNVSNKHLKTIGWHHGTDEDSYMGAVARRFPVDSIQYQLLLSKVDILGVHLLEEYFTKKSPAPYYKCILCGAHGKGDAIVKHMIGDKHTDKYIRLRIDGGLDIIGDKRADLRSFIREKEDLMEGWRVEDIRSFRVDKLYPWKWEDEGRTEEFLERKFQRLPLSPVPRLRLRPSPSPAAPAPPRRVAGVSVAQQSDPALPRCLEQLAGIIASADDPRSAVYSVVDAQECLRILFSLGNLLFYALEVRQLRQPHPALKATLRGGLEAIKKMQGAVAKIMAKELDEHADVESLTALMAAWQGVAARP